MQAAQELLCNHSTHQQGTVGGVGVETYFVSSSENYLSAGQYPAIRFDALPFVKDLLTLLLGRELILQPQSPL